MALLEACSPLQQFSKPKAAALVTIACIMLKTQNDISHQPGGLWKAEGTAPQLNGEKKGQSKPGGSTEKTWCLCGAILLAPSSYKNSHSSIYCYCCFLPRL